MGRTVDELEHTMTVREFNEWKLYHQNALFPMDRQELQMAQLMMMVSSYMGGKPKSEDFLLRARTKVKNTTSKLADKVKNIFGGLSL